MTQEELIKVEVPIGKLDLLTREELIEFFKLEQNFRIKLQKENEYFRAYTEELRQKAFFIEDKYIVIKNKFFGKSSERSLKKSENDSNSNKNKSKKIKVQLPSARYPDAPLIERHVELADLPPCSCCGGKMKDSGMTENSEFLTVIPKQYFIILQMRHKYRCSKCHGDIVTAPPPPRIKEGSSYSDEMMVDVGLTKYCDLVPIDRYSHMAGREGLKDLPPQSLIETTHYLADFTKGAYDKLKTEITQSSVLHADETPHRMLEGDEKTNWYLWGFSTPKTSFFEYHNTRSGDVASELLMKSKCNYLVSDVFSGYAKAVREANEIRAQKGQPKILNVYCNAHARRKFKEAQDRFPDDAEFFIDQYSEIYHLESQARDGPANQVMGFRQKMVPYYEAMKTKAISDYGGYSKKSSLGKAFAYFLKNFNELTLFLKNVDLPIDNNPQERLLRSPVIGRKTWYGTHSKRGAETAAILFSLVESCKLNKINPREYFKTLIQHLHQKKSAFTPAQFKNLSS